MFLLTAIFFLPKIKKSLNGKIEVQYSSFGMHYWSSRNYETHTKFMNCDSSYNAMGEGRSACHGLAKQYCNDRHANSTL